MIFKYLIFVGFLNISAELLLAFSIVISLKTCVLSRYNLVNVEKEGFTTTVGNILIIFSSLVSIPIRVLSLVMYFGPCLGLFNLLNHWKREQVRFKPQTEGGPFVEGGNFTTHNVSINWKELERNVSSLGQTSYTLYTGVSIKWLYVMFIAAMVVDTIVVYLVKNCTSSHFRSGLSPTLHINH